MANQISMKFCVDTICQIDTCQAIQSYSPGSATFPHCFASFNNPVAVTTVAGSVVFPSNRASTRPYYSLQLIRSTQQAGLVLMGFWAGISIPDWQPHWTSWQSLQRWPGLIAATRMDRLR